MDGHDGWMTSSYLCSVEQFQDFFGHVTVFDFFFTALCQRGLEVHVFEHLCELLGFVLEELFGEGEGVELDLGGSLGLLQTLLNTVDHQIRVELTEINWTIMSFTVSTYVRVYYYYTTHL